MCKKLSLLICLVFVLGAAGSASAADWTGNGDGTSWYDPCNWDPGVPGPSEAVEIDCPPAQGPIITGDVTCGNMQGPAWSGGCTQTMDITGGTVTINGMWRPVDGAGTGIINITGGSISIGGDFRWGDTAGGYGAVTITNATLTAPLLRIGDRGGGELNVGYGATVTIGGMLKVDELAQDSRIRVNGGLLKVLGEFDPVGGDCEVDLADGRIECATYNFGSADIDINDGTFVIDGNQVSDVLADGKITAFDGAPGSKIHVTYDAGEDETIVTASTVYTWAREPSPGNYAENLCPDSVVLTWTAGAYADEHDVYLGTDYNDVRDADTATSSIYKGTHILDANSYIPAGLDPGMTYYWRIDEVNDACAPNLWAGDVWHFSTNDGKAYDGDPLDGQTAVPLDADLSWTPGCWANTHDVYFGTSFDDVNSATTTTSSGVYLGNQEPNTYDLPADFNYVTVYYWRIDEVGDSNVWKGKVWSFRSQNAIIDVNMVVWYEFEETEGSAVSDSSGYEHHGGLIGVGGDAGVSWEPNEGRFGGALRFQTSDSYALSVPSDTLSSVENAVTISLWVNDEPGETGSILAFDAGDSGSGGANKLMAWVPDDNGDVSWRAGADDANDVLVWQSAPQSTWRGEWHHFAFVKDQNADTMKIYFDGLEVDSKTGLSSNLDKIGDKPFSIGAFNDDNGSEHGAAFDDFRAYKRALTDNEIAGLFIGDDIELAWAPEPYNGEVDVPIDVDLIWRPGAFADTHDVYFGTSWDDVNSATTSTSSGVYLGNQEPNTYNLPADFNYLTVYYWRIDEVNEPNTWKGNIWSFTAANFIVIDDFESYNDTDNVLYDTWEDGVTNLNSSSVIWLGTDPNVHGGDQSIEFLYENSNDWWSGHYWSEIVREYDTAQDWTVRDTKILTLYFKGKAGNAAGETEEMFVALEDAGTTKAVVTYDGDANDVKLEDWTEWNIALSDFTNVDMNNVKIMWIGFGDPDTQPVPGGDGTVFFDDIRLYPPRCIIAWPGLPEDLSGNCVVDYLDVEIMGEQWLLTDKYLTASAPGTGPIGWWKLDETAGSAVADSGSGGNSGTAEGNYSWVSGVKNNALEFSGAGGRVLVPDAAVLRPTTQEVSTCAWINSAAVQDAARIVVKGADNKESYELEAGDNESLIFVVREDSNTDSYPRFEASADDVLRENEWIHAAGTFDGSVMKLYVNGELVASENEPNLSGITLSQDANGLAIGSRSDAMDRRFIGMIDDVQVYDYALTQDEVVYVAVGPTGYFELNASANLYDLEGAGSQAINFKDYAVLMNAWLVEKLWPDE